MKTHLQANKGTNGQAIYSACSSKYVGNGKLNRNSRSTYRDIPAENIVAFEVFKTVPSADRCSHCMDRGLIMRNSQRARNGKSPVKSLFEGIEGVAQ